jgi:serine/threonine protein kinase
MDCMLCLTSLVQVLQDDVTLPPPGSVSDLCRDFLALCLQRDPARRPAATALLTHPWVAQAAATDVKGLMRRTMFDAEDRCVGSMWVWHVLRNRRKGQRVQDV